MASILDIATDAAAEVSLPPPSGLFSASSDATNTKLLRMITRTCRQLANVHDWTALRREHTFATVAQAEQTNAWPSDGDFRRFVRGSIWNRTTTWQVMGPLSVDDWQAHQAQVTSRVHDAFIIRDGAFLMEPVPPAGETIAYEYVSKAVGTNAAADTYRLAFAADDDIPLIDDDELITLGVVWRLRASEGLDYSEEVREYDHRVATLRANDGGQRVINMIPSKIIRPRAPAVPDTIDGL